MRASHAVATSALWVCGLVGCGTSAPPGASGYQFGEVTMERPRGSGSSMAPATATERSECNANEVAVGIAAVIEARGYVQSVMLQCAALDATGAGFGTPRWAGAEPDAQWSSASCPPGQHLAGLLVAAGDIIDRIGATCAPLGWTESSARTALGPWGGMLTPVPALCPSSSAVSGLTVSSIDYFGGSTANVIEARCRQVTPR